MRRIFFVLLSFLVVLVSVPVARAEKPAAFITIGMLADGTTDESVIVRGTAPAGMTVALEVNGRLDSRVIAGPSMSTYWHSVSLDPGLNRIVAVLEGTDIRTEKWIVRANKTFKDLAGSDFQLDCEILATLGIVNGISAEQFGPNLSLTRAQYAKLVVLGLGLAPAENPTLTFTDTAAIPDWARGYVAVAVERGLITGFEDGTFRAGEPVLRAQVAVIAARALRGKGIEHGKGLSKRFPDDDRIPAWAQADVELTKSAGLVGDFWGKEFDPDVPATRGLAAAVVRRLYSSGK